MNKKFKYHSTYLGYRVYYNPELKCRPWSVRLYSGRERGEFADQKNLGCCHRLIFTQARHDREEKVTNLKGAI